MIYKKNESKSKKQLRAVQKQINSYYNLEIPQKCPYCGGKMVIRKIGDYSPDSINAEKLLCVCEHYNKTCTCSLKVKENQNGKLIPKSIPADKNLKSMRCEAHYYMDAILRYYIYDTMEDIYNHLSKIENIDRNLLHIAAHPDKVRGRVNPYYSTFPGIKSISEKDAAAKELLVKIKQQVR